MQTIVGYLNAVGGGVEKWSISYEPLNPSCRHETKNTEVVATLSDSAGNSSQGWMWHDIAVGIETGMSGGRPWCGDP